MRRLTPLLFVFVGLLGALYVMPMTRWVVRTDLRQLLKLPDSGLLVDFPTITYGTEEVMEKKNADIPAPDNPNDLGDALISSQYIDPRVRTDEDPNLNHIRKYAKEHPKDPVSRAYLCTRIASFTVRSTAGEKSGKPKPLTKLQLSYCEETLRLTREGELIDPDNLFFPLVRSATLVSLDRMSDAKVALLVAAQKTEYREYLNVIGDAMVSSFERKFGYRGELARVAVFGSLNLGHYSLIRQLGKWARNSNDWEIKKAVFVASDVLIRKSTTVIGILVGKSTIGEAMGLRFLRKGYALSVNEVIDQAREVDQRAGVHQFNLAGYVEKHKGVFDMSKPFHAGDNDSLYNEGYRKVANRGSIAIIWSVVLLYPIFLGLSWLVARKSSDPRLARLAPHFAWFLVLAFGIEFVLPLFVPGCALMVLAFLANGKQAKYIRLAGYVLGLAMCLAAYSGFLGGIVITLLYAVSDFMSNRDFKPWLSFATSWIFALGFLAAIPLVAVYAHGQSLDTIGYGLIVAILAFSILPRSAQLSKWVPFVAMCLFILGYMGSVAWRIQDNNQWRAELNYWKQEGQQFRIQRGITD